MPPATTRKRKSSTSQTTDADEPDRKTSKTLHPTTKEPDPVDTRLPATPETLGLMESDDDFNSVASSMDLGDDDQDSSVDFGADGAYESLGITCRADADAD